MMLRVPRVLIVLAALLLLTLTAAAQDEQLIGDLDGYYFYAPAAWSLEQVEDFEDVYFWESENGYGFIALPHAVPQVITYDETTTDYDALKAYVIDYFGFEPDDEFIVDYETEFYYGVAYQGTADNDDLMDVITMAFDGPYFLIFELYAPEATFDAATAEFKAMVDTFLVAASATIPVMTAGLDGSAPLAECYASVDAEGVARLRVGPGENRTAVAFLPPEIEAQVIGYLNDDDGALWLQLDKATAAPDSAAAEIWVDADSVAAAGDCDSVAEVSAPPVLPIIDRPGSPQGGAPGGADRSLQSGAYRLVFPAEFPGSCADGSGATLQTADIFGAMSEGLDVNVTYNGSSIDLGGGDIVYRVNNQLFSGSFDLGGGRNLQVRLTVTSDTSFSGELTENFTVEGVACSATLPFTSQQR
jgi:hypothetical protein